MKRIIAILAWVIVLTALITYLISHFEDLKKLLHLSISNIITLVFLFIITQLLNGLRIMLFIGKVGIRLNIWECFSVANVNTMINYLPFKGGLFATAIYLKNTHALSYTNFASITIASHIVQLLTVTFVTTFLIAIYSLLTGVFLVKLFYIFCLLFVGILLATLLFKGFIKNIVNASRWQKIQKVINGLNIIISDRRLLLKLVLINFLAILVMSVRFAISFKIVSYDAPLILSFLAGQVKIIAVLLGIIPSGLGIAELFAGGVSEMMHAGVDMGVYAASVDRVISVLTLIFVGSISFVYLYTRRKSEFNNK